MLAPPELVCELLVDGLRSSGVFSPPGAFFETDEVNAKAGLAHKSRQPNNNAATCVAARESEINLVIEDDSEEESPPVIGSEGKVLRLLRRTAG
jgi:hypothetical protein